MHGQPFSDERVRNTDYKDIILVTYALTMAKPGNIICFGDLNLEFA